MITTSELYKDILKDPDRRVEYRLDIGKTQYGMGNMLSLGVHYQLFPQDTLSIGGAVSAELDITLRGVAEEPEVAGQVRLYVRVVSGDRVSEWLPHGVFFVDTRARDYVTDTLTLHCYDVLIMAEYEWEPDQSLEFPLLMSTAAEEIATELGTSLDPRCTFADYTMEYPVGLTLRGVLQEIAAAHGGNWIATYEGKLLLVALDSLPEETWYLVREDGTPINFGGAVILIDHG